MNNKKTLAGAGIALALGLPIAGQAQVVFDADGGFNNLGDVPTPTDAFDFLPGNALAVGALPLAVGTEFTLLYHAELVEIIRSTATNISPPVGSAGPAELTAVAALQERLIAVNDLPGGTPGVPEVATITHLGGTFNIYYDNLSGGTVNANDVTTNGGLGYKDGVLILSGTILPADIGGNFVVTTGSGTARLDNLGTNGTPAATSVLGQGSTDIVIRVGITSFDRAFFPNGITTLEFSSSLRLNFNTINNSVVFEQPTIGPNIVPNYGLGPQAGSNGRVAAGDTTPQDFQFLADGSASLSRIPEPNSIALLGLGLGGLGLASVVGTRRRKTA